MNIYMRELKAHRKSLIIWCVGMVFLIAAGMGKYSAGAAAGDNSMNELMLKMPKSLQNLFGVGVFDLTIALDFFSVLFLYILFMAAIHAVMLGSGIISKEERDRTAEFLLVKPVSRRKIMTAKIFASVTILAVFFLVTYAASYGILSYYSKGAAFESGLMKLMASFGAIQLLFLSTGIFFAAVFKNPKRAGAAGTAVMMIMYILAVIVDIVEKLDFLKYLSFFKYYDAKDILKGNYPVIYPVISAAVICALIYGAYYFYQRRDMKI